jgi:hypothetical protein
MQLQYFTSDEFASGLLFVLLRLMLEAGCDEDAALHTAAGLFVLLLTHLVSCYCPAWLLLCHSLQGTCKMCMCINISLKMLLLHASLNSHPCKSSILSCFCLPRRLASKERECRSLSQKGACHGSP